MPTFDPAHIVLATLVGSLILFVTDRFRYDVIAIGVVLVLTLTECLPAKEAFAGFASPAVVLIVSMYVFAHAFTRWGVAEALSRRFLTGRDGGELGLAVRVTVVAGLLSSVLSNTGVVAMLIPVCSGLARTHRIPLSRLLMPMAFGSLLGGIVTVLGTSNNIVINEQILEGGGEPFSLFEFSHYGLILLAISIGYIVGPGRLLLPRSPLDQSLSERYQVPTFVTEILVEPSSTLINRAVADADVFTKYDVTVLGIVRAGGESTVLAPGPYNRIRADDTLILQGAPDDILRLGRVMPLKERASVEAGDTRLYSDDVRLVESVVPSGSAFVGQTIHSSEVQTRTGLNVLALSKNGEVQLQRVQDTPMEVGDMLLLQGHRRDIERAKRERGLLILDELQAPRFGRGSLVTIVTLLAVLILASLTDLDLAVLGVCGAVCLVLTGVVRTDEIPKVIDWPVVVLIGGMLALGHAFERYHLASDLAKWLTGLGEDGLGPEAILLVLLVGTVLLTQVLNHVSTAVIMTPVAMDLARALEVDSRAFLMAVVTGSSLAFLSPVAHQANAMVMGPGGYRYRDYLRAGTPLAVITIAAAWVLLPWLWPLTPLGG